MSHMASPGHNELIQDFLYALHLMSLLIKDKPDKVKYVWLVLFTAIKKLLNHNYNMTVRILAGNYTSFTIAAGLIRLHMPGVKKSRV